MVIDEVLSSVSSIPDPYIRVLTYGRIGVILARAKDPRHEKAFKLALSELTRIEDPYTLVRALLVTGYLTGLAGLKSAKRAFREAIEYSNMLPRELRDKIKAEAVDYLLSLNNPEEALFYASQIENKKLRNAKLLEILSKTLEVLDSKEINVVYKRRKIELILEHIKDEPYRSEAIVRVIRPLLSGGYYKRVIELIGEIKSKPWIKQALSEVLLFLRTGEGEGIEEIIELSKSLAKKSGRDIREDLAYIFAIHGFTKQSIDVLLDLPNRGKIAGEIFDSLLMRGTKALEDFVNFLPDDIIKEMKGKLMSIMNEENPEFSSIVKVIVERTSDESILVGAVKYFLTINKLEYAVSIIKRLKTEKARSTALGFLAYYLIKRGKIGEAVDVVLEIRDRNLASKLASEILVKAVEGEVYERLPNEKERERNYQLPS
ncbi:hypothetical protein [Pyrococcus abyssi]|uniref:Uncharacterized protein n=1 Tax=Pyrococcus abyssi (strain GE5 / Orsay) TaxID=272844 RepID=Q9UYT9_PYRAB|nr:hypothetical protein [Pyrococcus abyssi]CAB50323.1 Hypothetical protein PAB0940 [Pyrococcus abyssi GE5]CCE70862.1 TPA: hypothetical protein PAB0940 [Pyrococcus abyssi GE5]